ncbi:bifunctional 4-hydroxy-3-methylbut-2-enyl diphosphate reductase/30S ribosomal protein S1 [Clostridium ihumii]|uniref:bifunctional 4-hydroxy-3-methylbut-2-enyl diphosphate reductase/30S ribosomal protein S1 n=1 Tax=Clostridium ihumii TaxID=1470356 RepID=UPI0005914661|nr:bifunctional 4-hydroxy-3-methylbut-2-enyl diphosphate reductase/30S ribosomal protein S1 [Clostridium ihumii]
MRQILLAKEAGFCFGVKRAVDTALNKKKEYKNKIYTLGPLIHNNDVVNLLEENNIYHIDINGIDNLKEGDVIIIRSHGISKSILEKLHSKKLNVVDATCPYVTKIQMKVKEYYDLGYGILIVGDKDHPEVIGINGWCNNTAIISKGDELLQNLPKKIFVVSQTTEKQCNFDKVLDMVSDKCSEVVALNTICNATEVRQKAANDLSKEVDTMVVIGGYNSSNTTKLYEICKKNCKNTIHVENAGEIPMEFIHKANKIGITAGASTPDWIIKEAVLKMKNEVMENEMLQYEAYMNNNMELRVGKVIKGEVFKVSEKEAYLTITGAKNEGLLPIAEVTKDENAKLNEIINVGEMIEAKIISVKNSDGYIVVSRIEIEREGIQKELKSIFENKEEIEVKITNEVKGGVIATYKGIRVFIPASHISLEKVNNLSEYMNKTIKVKIIEFEKQRNGMKIVGSRREILQGEKDKKEEQTWNNLEKDTVVEGIVRRISSFGAFVEVQGVDGLLHISEMSWNKVVSPKEVVKIGETIKVYVLDVDKENKKLALSLKKLQENPWSNVNEKYPVGNVVLGKVVRFADFGAFVELEPGVDGLVHISQISDKKVDRPSSVLKVGQEIKAVILETNEETKRISLSIKAVDEM